jgi:hypothetical protein
MIESYADRYPSRLPGGALEGSLPPGPDDAPKPVSKPGYDPSAPQPDAEHYDPSKVKIPEHKDDPAAAPATDAPADDAAPSKPAPTKKKKKTPSGG